MKIVAAVLFAAVMSLAPVFASAVEVKVQADTGFDAILSGLNVEAQTDFAGFVGKLSARFGQAQDKVEAVIKSVEKPADAYMALKVAETVKKPVDEVVKEYTANKDKGWGQIARNLGIKPGSKEFKALKQSDLGGKGKGKGQGKEKGQGKGKGKKG
jgi:tRNA nucleotidyltransferase/poly(A) polymerase